MAEESAVEIWRYILEPSRKSWVLFESGTCVILKEPHGDLARQAVELLREWGPVYVGSPAGDFSTRKLRNGKGWVVTCHHEDIATYVASKEVNSSKTGDIVVGILGRSKRGRDAELLQVVHVEDKRVETH